MQKQMPADRGHFSLNHTVTSSTYRATSYPKACASLRPLQHTPRYRPLVILYDVALAVVRERHTTQHARDLDAPVYKLAMQRAAFIACLVKVKPVAGTRNDHYVLRVTFIPRTNIFLSWLLSTCAQHRDTRQTSYKNKFAKHSFHLVFGKKWRTLADHRLDVALT